MSEEDGPATAVVDIDDSFFQDPYSAYRKLRRYGEVHRMSTGPGRGLWLVTGYETAMAALSDRRLSKDSDALARAMQVSVTGDAAEAARASAYGDFMRSFTQHVSVVVREQLRPELVNRVAAGLPAMVHDILDRIPSPAGVSDLVTEFTIPYAVESACELIGIPADLRPQVTTLLTDTILSPDPEIEQASSVRLARLITALMTERLVHPRADLLTAISTKVADSGGPDEDETVRGAMLLMIISVETTFSFLGNAICALLAHPGELRRLRADPGLFDNAMEELLRFDGAHNISSLRCVTEDLVLAGTPLAAGDLVAVSLASANHDEARFEDPDQLDLTRTVSAHLAFGHGMHRCLGARYARLQGRAALGVLLERFPALQLAVDPADVPRISSAFLRSVHTLPVVLTP
ncbi:Cytochrome P450 [Amycolatopsis marina]|uniref:Cytochrome P450 n=1 Tax=Amycolatopsis marina TaxID=490629 RepID=A0A1I0WVL4_9PSEU|nr:cytochrome P450 [Amycolatopsis marina]SFA92691.1 Cytochrome P450 [Amycolatopsis marina]